MKRIIFVDGYNIINSWSELKKIKEYDFSGARKKLIDILENYATYKGDKVIIVFDAHMVEGSIEKKEKYGNTVVVFTKEGEIADNYIERHVNNIGRKVNVTVVTSDSIEQQITFQRGANRMSSNEFYKEIKNIENNISKKVEKRYSLKRNYIEDIIEKDVLVELDKIRNKY